MPKAHKKTQGTAARPRSSRVAKAPKRLGFVAESVELRPQAARNSVVFAVETSNTLDIHALEEQLRGYVRDVACEKMSKQGLCNETPGTSGNTESNEGVQLMRAIIPGVQEISKTMQWTSYACRLQWTSPLSLLQLSWQAHGMKIKNSFLVRFHYYSTIALGGRVENKCRKLIFFRKHSLGITDCKSDESPKIPDWGFA